VKMFEVGYKRTGDIQPVRVHAEAKAGTSDTPNIYARRLYLPEWRKEAIENRPKKLNEVSSPKVSLATFQPVSDVLRNFART
jgi:hypothetical protein